MALMKDTPNLLQGQRGQNQEDPYPDDMVGKGSIRGQKELVLLLLSTWWEVLGLWIQLEGLCFLDKG